MKSVKSGFRRLQILNLLRRLLFEVVLSNLVDDLFREVLLKIFVSSDILFSYVPLSGRQRHFVLLSHL